MGRPLKILYLAAGEEHTTSQQRGRALGRCGHDLTIVDLTRCMPRNIWLARAHRVTGFRGLDGPAARLIERAAAGRRFDVVWVDNGTVVGTRCLRVMRQLAPVAINYNLDDPTGRRDGNRWLNFKRTIPLYDLLVTVRRKTEVELRALGARKVYRVFRSYDEVEHAPLALTESERAKWRSEVLFVGTWMPERSVLFRTLLAGGVPLTIHGDFWPRSPEWKDVQHVWRGPAIYGRDYVAAIQCAKVCLGLVSKGNRDLHTQRSAEIPAIGALFCGERTDEHLVLFEDRKEAVLWSTPEECVSVCHEMLAEEPRRAAIARAGQAKVKTLRLGNEAVLGGALERFRSEAGELPR